MKMHPTTKELFLGLTAFYLASLPHPGAASARGEGIYKNSEIGFQIPCPAECDVQLSVNNPDDQEASFFLHPNRLGKQAIRVSKSIHEGLLFEEVIRRHQKERLGETEVSGKRAVITRSAAVPLEPGGSKLEYRIVYWVEDAPYVWRLERPEAETYKPIMDRVIKGFKILPVLRVNYPSL